MDNNEIKRTNRKALPKFILLFVVCALIGGVIGYFSGKCALNELTGSIKAAGAFFGTRIAPWLMLALAVIVPAVCVPIYRSAKKLIGMWDGEDEELADIIDGKISTAMWISSAALVISYFLIAASYSAGFAAFDSRPGTYAVFASIVGFLAIMVETIVIQQKCVDAAKHTNPVKDVSVYDMKFQKKCLDKMRQAAQRDGKTVLYVSHNMSTIRDLCDRCIVLDKGKVIFDGDVDEGIALYLSTKSQEASFIDYSGVKRDNWFKRDNIRLQSVELLDADNEVLERRKPVTVRYRVHVNEAAADVGLRLEMRDEVGNPLGATCVYGLDLQPGYTTFTARYDLSVLAPGKYGSYFTVITQGEGGAHTVEDWVPGMMFRMVDTLTEGETEWNTTAWGPIELPTAAVVEVQHD